MLLDLFNKACFTLRCEHLKVVINALSRNFHLQVSRVHILGVVSGHTYRVSDESALDNQSSPALVSVGFILLSKNIL